MPVDGVPEGYYPVKVEIGISDNYNVEIKSGLEEGTTVFTTTQLSLIHILSRCWTRKALRRLPSGCWIRKSY